MFLLDGTGHATESYIFQRPTLPADQNAYTYWTNAIPELRLPQGDVLNAAFDQASNLSSNMPEGNAQNVLKVWLVSKKEPLGLFNKGITLGKFQFPVFSLHDFGTTHLAGLRQVARVKSVQGRILATEAKYSEAADEFMGIFNAGQLIISGDGPMIHYLVGIAVESIGLSRLRWLCCCDDVPDDVLLRVLRQLPVPESRDMALAQTYRAELDQCAIPAILEVVSDAKTPTNDFPVRIDTILDLTNTLELVRTFNSRFVTNALSPWIGRDIHIEADAKAMVAIKGVTNVVEYVTDVLCYNGKKPNRETRRQWKRLAKLGRTTSNILGKIVTVGSTWVGDNVHERSVKMRAEINMTRTLITLQLYRRHGGKYPNSLADLIDKSLLPELPKDFFSEKPLLYSREKGLLWSVGADEVDNSGDPKSDLVLRLPAPASVATRRSVDIEYSPH